jgi:hypothetical protein
MGFMESPEQIAVIRQIVEVAQQAADLYARAPRHQLDRPDRSILT